MSLNKASSGWSFLDINMFNCRLNKSHDEKNIAAKLCSENIEKNDADACIISRNIVTEMQIFHAKKFILCKFYFA